MSPYACEGPSWVLRSSPCQLQRLCLYDPQRHRPGLRRIEGSPPRPHQGYAETHKMRPTLLTAPRSGLSPATSPCPALPRTRSTKSPAEALGRGQLHRSLRKALTCRLPRPSRSTCPTASCTDPRKGFPTPQAAWPPPVLEMSQNSGVSWSFEEVDAKLKEHHGGHLHASLRCIRGRRLRGQP